MSNGFAALLCQVLAFSQKCKGALTTVHGSAKWALRKSVWKVLKNLELNLPHAI